VAFTVPSPDPFAVSGKVVAVRISLIPPAPFAGNFRNVKVYSLVVAPAPRWAGRRSEFAILVETAVAC